MSDQSNLLERVRELIETGNLRSRRPDRLRGRRGSGTRCNVCDGSLTLDQIEFELAFGRNGMCPVCNVCDGSQTGDRIESELESDRNGIGSGADS